jgi:hypothetical protein
MNSTTVRARRESEKVARVFLNSKGAAGFARADFHVFLFPSQELQNKTPRSMKTKISNQAKPNQPAPVQTPTTHRMKLSVCANKSDREKKNKIEGNRCEREG